MKSKTRLIVLVGAVALAAGCTPIAQAAGSQQWSNNPNFNTSSPARTELSNSARSVFENYFKIQPALAQDSLQGVAEAAAAIAKAARTEPVFSSRVADRADKLARAKTLAQARSAFLRLSPWVTQYAKKARLPGVYEGWCRMHWAFWLQTGQTIANPYCGKAEPNCGRLRDLNGKWIS